MYAVVIGLHITKCAGTAFAVAVRRQRLPNEWYQCSDYPTNLDDATMDISERSNLDRLRFIFGHYVHQSLLPLFADRRVVLITGLREPVSRAVSEYYHICRMHLEFGRPVISAADYFADRKDTLCVELLRAFPAAQSLPGSMAARAEKVLQLFDLIYTSDNLEQTLAPVSAILGLPPGSFPRENERSVSTEHADYLDEQAAVIRQRATEFFAQDIALYEAVSPAIGRWIDDSRSWRERWQERSEGEAAWFAPVMQDPDPWYSFQSHQATFMAADFRYAGKTKQLELLLERKRNYANLIESELRRQIEWENQNLR